MSAYGDKRIFSTNADGTGRCENQGGSPRGRPMAMRVAQPLAAATVGVGAEAGEAGSPLIATESTTRSCSKITEKPL